jgi:hypothetical protein
MQCMCLPTPSDRHWRRDAPSESEALTISTDQWLGAPAIRRWCVRAGQVARHPLAREGG